MAKARVTTRSGAKVTVEGTPDEVAALISRLEAGTPASKSKHRPAKRVSVAKATATGLIGELIDGGFFKKPKELSAIKMALAEQGHHYPVTSLSPVVLRLVRKRQLRRIKDQKRWLYVN